MSKWGTSTPKERESAPASVFCGPGRSFPVADKADFDNAVHALGRAKGDTGPIRSCMIRKARASGWPLPDSWKGMSIAAFAVDADVVTDDLVTRTGKIFEVGDYPDKQFTVTPEDLYLATLDFQPVPNDLEHLPTILDGKLGRLTSVTISDDGATLMGTVEIPRWLHDQIGDQPVSTSLMWDRESKQIVGNALVLDPRVPDAALMSAYTAFAATQPQPEPERPATGTTEGFTGISQADAVSYLHTLKAIVTGIDPVPSERPSPVTATVPEKAKGDDVSFADSDEYKAMQAKLTALEADNAARAERERTRDAEVMRERAGVF